MKEKDLVGLEPVLDLMWSAEDVASDVSVAPFMSMICMASTCGTPEPPPSRPHSRMNQC